MSKSANVLEDPGQVPHAEHDQHQSDGHLHGQADPRWDHDREEDNGPADRHYRQAMPDPPQASDYDRRSYRRLTGHDRADRNHMVGVRGMAHAENKAEQCEREDRNHLTWIP